MLRATLAEERRGEEVANEEEKRKETLRDSRKIGSFVVVLFGFFRGIGSFLVVVFFDRNLANVPDRRKAFIFGFCFGWDSRKIGSFAVLLGLSKKCFFVVFCLDYFVFLFF